MAIHAHSTTAHAVQAGLLPLIPFVFRPAAPSDNGRDPVELLEEIRRIVEADPELPLEPLLPSEVFPGFGKNHSDLSPKSGENSLPGFGEQNALATARTLHLRRQLAQAAEHGAALLASLGLPRLVGPDHIVVDPVAAGDALDLAIATLDALDGDADLEDGHDAEHDTADIEDDGTAEHTLGAPERHPYTFTMGSPHYRPADGSHYRAQRYESQASWAQGARQDGETESEVGYDLPCDEDELDDDGLSKAEGDGADEEPWLASPIGDGNHEHWAQGGSRDAEDATEGDGQPAPNWYARPIGAVRPDVHGYQHEREMRAIARQADTVRRRLHPAMGPRRDPDEVVFLTGTYNGMSSAMWGGPIR